MDSIGRTRFNVALQVATIFKVLAVLAAIGGVVGTITVGIDMRDTARDLGTENNVGAFFIGSGAAIIVTSSFLAFFGYVLEILVEIYEQVWHERHGEFESHEDDDEDA